MHWRLFRKTTDRVNEPMSQFANKPRGRQRSGGAEGPAAVGRDPRRSATANLQSEIANQKSVRCPLCGHSFQAGEAAACSTCGLGARCGLVMCPNCSYEFAP